MLVGLLISAKAQRVVEQSYLKKIFSWYRINKMNYNNRQLNGRTTASAKLKCNKAKYKRKSIISQKKLCQSKFRKYYVDIPV